MAALRPTVERSRRKDRQGRAFERDDQEPPLDQRLCVLMPNSWCLTPRPRRLLFAFDPPPSYAEPMHATCTLRFAAPLRGDASSASPVSSSSTATGRA